jgi:nucleotide-binding universal stress UspA family protein
MAMVMWKVLLGVDGSAGSLAAVRHVIDLARAGAKVEAFVVAAQEPTYLYELILPPDSEVLERWSATAGRQAIEQAEALLRAAGIGFESEVVPGDPARVLLAAAERHGCDLMVIGARGRGPVKGLLLGSVSQAVLQGARVPVTIVRLAHDA